MKILLINPCLRPESPSKILPVGLACIATALERAGFAPDIFDIDLNRYTEGEVTNFLETNQYDVIGFGNIVSSYNMTKRLAKQIKKAVPNSILIVGNTVASVPGILLNKVPEVDFAVIGEGDKTIVDLVNCIMKKESAADIPGIAFRDGQKVIITKKRQVVPDIREVPFPNYSLFNFNEYLKVSHMLVAEPYPLPVEEMRAIPFNTARGCPFDCTFCTHAFKGDKYRYYPFEMAMKEVKRLQNSHHITYLAFWDELTLNSRKRTVELCDAIESEGLEIFWSVNPRGNLFGQKDLDLLKRCKSLGALTIGGALESGSPEILTAMNKHMRPEQYINQVNIARKARLVPLTSVVFGYPQETRMTIKMTFDVCRRCGIYPSVGFVLPLPGAEMYRYAREKGLIPDEEEYLLKIGDRQDLHLNLTSMTDDELVNTVTEELIRLKNDLGIPLADDKVIKTTTYRAATASCQDSCGDK